MLNVCITGGRRAPEDSYPQDDKAVCFVAYRIVVTPTRIIMLAPRSDCIGLGQVFSHDGEYIRRAGLYFSDMEITQYNKHTKRFDLLRLRGTEADDLRLVSLKYVYGQWYAATEDGDRVVVTAPYFELSPREES